MEINDRFAVREHGTNPLGWRLFETSPGLDGPHAGRTLFLDHDAFGRPRTLRPPDGANHDVTLTYVGAREIRRTANVRVDAVPEPETAVTTIERYDVHGRLVELVEPNQVVTRYEYDAADRLRRVCQKAEGTTCGQERRFGWDGRGFLAWEHHPEKDPNASGSGHDVDYLLDARGHVIRKRDGAFDLRYVYDAAERLTRVEEVLPSPSPPRVWKELESTGPSTAGAARRRGSWSGPRVRTTSAASASTCARTIPMQAAAAG